MSPRDSPRVFRFGPYTLEEDTLVLRRRATRVPLAPKPAQMLWYLAERSGTVVTRADLHKAVWSNQAIELVQSINTCLRQIRRALADDARAPTWIQTIPRRGYRFLQPVDEVCAGISGRSGATQGRRARTRTTLVTAGAVAAAVLTAWLLPRPGERPGPPGSEVRDSAVTHYQMADHFLGLGTPEGARRSINGFHRSLTANPEFAPSHVGLALAFLRLGESDRARFHAARAVNLADGSPSAHIARARIALTIDWDFADAARSLEHAQALAPTWAPVHYWLAYLRSAQGRHEEALEHANQVIAREPAWDLGYALLGWTRYRAGDNHGAQLACEEAVDFAPIGNTWEGSLCLTVIALATGDTAQAARAAARVVAASGAPPDVIRQVTEGPPAASIRRYLEWRRHDPDSNRSHANAWYHRALASAALDDDETTLSLLEYAVAVHSPHLVTVGVEPRFHHLRADRRFRAVLRAVGLPDTMALAGSGLSDDLESIED